jgi:hypothetical protein
MALLLEAVIGIADAISGDRIVLIGFLVLGPACAALSLRPGATATVSGCAIALAVPLGLRDDIWFTPAHVLWIAVVALVGVTNTAVVGIVAPRQHRSGAGG